MIGLQLASSPGVRRGEPRVPHLRIEYSASLEARADVPALVAVLHETMWASGLFELGGIRVRAFRADHVAIADLHPENAFAHITLRMGFGRSVEDRKRVGDALMAAARAALAPLFETPHFALSLEVQEIDAVLTWKDNAMHARLRNK